MHLSLIVIIINKSCYDQYFWITDHERHTAVLLILARVKRKL